MVRRLFTGRDTELIPQGRMSGPMPWVIAIMVAMTAIALAAGLALGNAVSSAKAEIEGGVTVQIIEPRADIRQKEAESAVAAIKTMPGVAGLRLVPQAELDALIEPWLGTGIANATGSAIPVPSLIDVRLKGPATPAALSAIEQRLKPVAPSARVDAQSNWLKPVFNAMVSLQVLAIAIVALLALALTAAVLLAARTALGTNRDTIEIVHLLGGTDAQVARVFQRSIGYDAAGGGAVGLALALVVILVLARRFAGLGAGLVNNGALTWGDWLLLALVPVLSTLLAMVTARLTVLHALRKML
ncbi:cell division protein [Novosphingobium indicum]|jgi:cell division transport system permease protein|uniref:Cell division protein n=1 Tax=Novosphingobium indicum TaxID=462949 RepID=A0ABQ2JTL1_9SPHN|nr:cell division protein [Novosphingobium indicum]GGN54276.1 cell division protein [Novosphingobium indicum]|tara:strand:+ start:1320 stop:2222 length:903 start_codon:yes stop_codon:yes gene_type:complete